VLLQVRGLPALQYFGNVVWKDDVFDKINTGALADFYRSYFAQQYMPAT
jgi:hypothetical protein